MVGQQEPEPPVVDAAVVRDHLEVAGARVVQRGDQLGRDAAEAEAADGQRGAVGDVGDGLGGGGEDLVGGPQAAAEVSSEGTSRL